MALSGSITKHFYVNNGYSVILEWTGTQSIANNTTTITANLYLKSNGSGYAIWSSANKTAKIVIDGSTYTKTTANVSVSGNQKRLIHTATKTVSHKADGTKSVVLGGSLEINIQLSQGWVGVVTLPNTTFALNTIPRASNITSFPNFTIGNSIPVTVSRASSNFTHNFTMHCGSTFIGEWLTKIGTSTTLVLNATHQDRIYRLIPNATSAKVRLTCRTYSGSTLIGSSYKDATAYVGSDIVPTFETITHSEHVSNVKDTVGKYVQSLSRLNLSITGAAGAKYSTIKSYQIDFDGVSYNARTATSAAIKGSGNLTVTGKVTDSRGRTCTKSVTVNVLPYAPPKITSLKLQRCNADGALNAMGIYVKVNRAGSVSSLVNVTEKNTLTYKILSKARKATSWTTKKTATISGISLTGNDIIGTYDAISSFDFRLYITDKFKTTISVDVLPTGKVTMSWGKDGVGIGKAREQGALDVLGEIFSDDALVPGVEWGATVNGGWVQFSNGLQMCWGSNTFPGEGWTGSGDKWYLLGQSLTFPATFDSNPTFLGTTQDPSIAARSAKLASFNVGTSDVTAMSFNGWGTTSSSFYLHWLAIGWWRELEES